MQIVEIYRLVKCNFSFHHPFGCLWHAELTSRCSFILLLWLYEWISMHIVEICCLLECNFSSHQIFSCPWHAELTSRCSSTLWLEFRHSLFRDMCTSSSDWFISTTLLSSHWCLYYLLHFAHMFFCDFFRMESFTLEARTVVLLLGICPAARSPHALRVLMQLV
jgi:hypothetical protein